MKRTLFLFCCLFFGTVSLVQAQGLKVSVHNDIKEPLPHAYVYVNGRAVAVADTLGLAVIPQDKLKLGDTISISYVATEGQSVVVDHDILTRGEYQFVLPEIYGTLYADAVVVKAGIEKFYHKHVKRLGRVHDNSIWTTDFSMTISKPGDSICAVGGKLEIKKMSPYNVLSAIASDPQFSSSYYSPLTAHDSTGRPAFWDHLPIAITSSDDTTGLALILQNSISSALQIVDYSITYSRIQAKTYMVNHYGSKLNYGYLGKDEHYRIFRLSYSAGELGHNWQIMIKCDDESGEIREITTNILNLSDGTVICVKSKIQTTIRGVNMMYVPIELEYRAEHNNGDVVDILMKNISFKLYYWTEADKQLFIKSIEN